MRSMTGCGRGSASENGWTAEVELKSVNHRFLDLALRLPRALSFLEEPVRRELSVSLRRGHVEIFVTVRREGAERKVTVDEEAARAYLRAAANLSRTEGLPNDLTLSALLQMPGVTTVAELDPEEEPVTACCLAALRDALASLLEMREREGRSLASDLSGYLDTVQELRGRIGLRAPGVVISYRARLLSRLEQLGAEAADPARIAQETAIMADRCAIDEELSRLDSHIGQMRAYLEEKSEVGKRMDFLVQEMNREANTIGSKAQNAEIAQLVVDMKSAIEKLREQIQNVE